MNSETLLQNAEYLHKVTPNKKHSLELIPTLAKKKKKKYKSVIFDDEVTLVYQPKSQDRPHSKYLA